MSILLIGQNQRFPANSRHLYSYQPQIQLPKDRKQIQQQYRLQLLSQMKEREAKRRQQRQRQLELDLKYQRMFYNQVSDKPHQQSQYRNSSRMNIDSQANGPSTQKHSRKGTFDLLPPIEEYKQNRFRIRPVQNQSYDTYNLKPRSRFKTQGYDKYDKYDNQQKQYNYQLLESPQVRQQQMKDELNDKLNEVYSLMAGSVKTLNEADHFDTIGSRLSPIKLNFDKQYKVKYDNYQQEDYQQTNKRYYKLPNISKSFKNDSVQKDNPNNSNSEGNWREWYAKQKLKQLQNRYSREISGDQRPIYENRLGTPTFYDTKI